MFEMTELRRRSELVSENAWLRDLATRLEAEVAALENKMIALKTILPKSVIGRARLTKPN
jgi:hypothetical protein